MSRKDERRIEMAFKIAHFPAVRELADFDFKAQPSIDVRQVRELATSRDITVDRARRRRLAPRASESGLMMHTSLRH